MGFGEVIALIVGFVLGHTPAWFDRKRRVKTHWHALRAETMLCRKQAEAFLAADIMAPLYLRTDQWIDAVFSLDSSVHFSHRAEDDAAWWKWLLVSVHAAVQGFMVLALERGNSLAVMKPHIAKAWLEAYEKGTPFTDEKMDFFLELYAKVKDTAVPGYLGSKPFRPGTTHDESMRKLNDFRNEFIHFMPKGWSLQLAGLPRIAGDCVEIAEFLAWESGQVLWHDAALSDRAKDAFKSLREQLGHLGGRYAREG